MNKITAKGIEKYLQENYGDVRHDCKRLKLACTELSKQYKCKSIEVFYFMIENRPIPNLNTHSYGFNTRFGRHIKYKFTKIYNNGTVLQNTKQN